MTAEANDDSTDASPLSGAKLVTVSTYITGWEAHLACNKLRAADVPACVIDENFNAIGYGSAAMGPARVQVREEDLQTALQVLATKEDYVDDEFDDDPRCPACGSTSEPASAPGWLLLISLPLFGIPYAFAPKYWRCVKCGRRFTERSNPLSEQAQKDQETMRRQEGRK